MLVAVRVVAMGTTAALGTLEHMSKPLSIDVVAIQSQVVYGCVGNTAAVPVLQAGLLQVAQVPSIILSSTPGYPSVHGGAVPLGWFRGWLDDLIANRALSELQAVQIGYLGEPEQASVLKDWLLRVLKLRPEVLIVLDPVLGDQDTGIYTHPGLVAGWHELLSMASGLTPNAFELGVLSGMPVDSSDEVVTAARSLLNGRLEWIVATSAAPREWPEGEMWSLIVTPNEARRIRHARVDSPVKGTGDMFTAGITRGLLEGKSLEAAAAEAGERVAVALQDSAAADSEELVMRRRLW